MCLHEKKVKRYCVQLTNKKSFMQKLLACIGEKVKGFEHLRFLPGYNGAIFWQMNAIKLNSYPLLNLRR
jgi:hypothetical protein